MSIARPTRGGPPRAVALAIVLALLVPVVSSSVAGAATDITPPTTPKNLRVTSEGPTQVAIAWDASTDDVGVVGYFVLRDGVKIARVGATTFTDAAVVADTTYAYRVRALDAAGNRSQISKKVLATTSTSVTIAAAGDVACATTDTSYNGGLGTATACRQLYTSNLLVNGDYDAVLALGDLQYDSGALSQFEASYDPTWGRVNDVVHPVVGNHEYGQSGASGYFTYFGAAAGPVGKGYYSFDVGSWHIVAINSNCSQVGGCGAGSAQETWLRADLSAHPAACTIAMWHHARWSSGHDGDNTFMQAMWKDLYDAHVEILLSGHSHDYERFAPQDANGALDTAQGVRQFVVGTGGAFFTGIGSAHANSQVRNNDTFGVLALTLRPTGYDWRFVPEAGRSFSDSGSDTCH